MKWLLLWAISGLAIALGYAVWRRWIAPWSRVENMIRQVARGERPRTFLINGGSAPRRVGLALEAISNLQQQLNHQIAERAVGTETIFAAMQDGLLVVDTRHRISLVNRSLRHLFGLGNSIVGHPILEIIREADLDRLIAETLRTGTPQGHELIISDSQSNSPRRMQLSAVAMKNEADTTTGAVVLFHDITQLKQADEIRRDFVANVSHELRTPLSIFHGNLETLLEAGDLDKNETRHIYEVMKRHSDRLNLLVNDLLSLARLESKEANLQLSEINLRDFLEGVTRDWAKRLAGKNLQLELEVPDSFPTLRADERRLEEVVHNLLDNAVKYSPQNGRILIQASAPDQEIVLSVRDEGVGIAAGELPRIFERFYRADRARSREFGGTGLGLSIVKHIAQLHGGRVEAESTLGQGTTIRVVLPTHP